MINGVNPDLLVISRSTHEDARTVVTPGTVLLRSVPSLTYTFRNEAGETIRSFTCGRADRSIYDVHTRSPRTVEDSAPGCDPWFNGYAPDGTELPDGRYTLTIEASSYGPSPAPQSISYSVILDTQAPVISNVTVSVRARTASCPSTPPTPRPSPVSVLGHRGRQGRRARRRGLPDRAQRGRSGPHPLRRAAERRPDEHRR